MPDSLQFQNSIPQPFLRKISQPQEQINDTLDTIVTVQKSAKKQHFFTEKSNQAYKNEALQSNNTDWVYGSFALILLLIVLIRVFFAQSLKDLFSSLISNVKLKSFEKDGRIFKETFSYLFLLVYSIGIAFGLIMIINFFEILTFESDGQQMLVFFISFVAVFTFIILKTILILSSGVLFKTIDISIHYAVNMLVHSFITVSIFIPFLVLYYFSNIPAFLYISIAIYAIMLIVRLLKGIAIAIGNSIFSLFHLILYICTLEILPVLLILEMARRVIIQ
jgi:hypothetical protein